MGAEDHAGARGDIPKIVDEANPSRSQIVHYVTVVHNLIQHIDRLSINLQRELDDINHMLNQVKPKNK